MTSILIGLFQKKSKQVGGVDDVEFSGVLKKTVEVPGVNQKRSEISSGVQKEIMWNFHGSWFLILEFPKSATQFCRTSKGEVLRVEGRGAEKYILSPLLLFGIYSGAAHFAPQNIKKPILEEKQTRGRGWGWGHIFLKPTPPPLNFLDFLLYPWKFQAKQGFTPRNFTKLCYTLIIFKALTQDPWKFHTIFSWSLL